MLFKKKIQKIFLYINYEIKKNNIKNEKSVNRKIHRKGNIKHKEIEKKKITQKFLIEILKIN